MNSMVDQVSSLPAMIRESFQSFDDGIRTTLDHQLCLSLKRVYLTGCGDSHHATLNTELAFESLAGLPTEPMTALQFARYGVGYLPETGPGTNAVIGISVSGEVARTLEALQLAKKAGATAIALTGTPGSRVALAGDYTLFSTTSPFPDPPGVHTPGVRSFTANQLALYLIAIRLGEVRGVLTSVQAGNYRRELLGLADTAERLIPVWDRTARQLAGDWADAQEFVFVGGGPNYGTALFSAAKVLEASGDPALGQETEEWAHLQYFARAVTTPTFLISAADRDLSRVVEVATAAKAIGRRIVAITSQSNQALSDLAEATFAWPAEVREMFSPLIAAIPGELFAAYRAEVIQEPFFRGFTGGRSTEGGGGISRIRNSDILGEVRL
jgi:glucosamine--fructose-6-phosphate aminotransferase (isomerizing)